MFNEITLCTNYDLHEPELLKSMLPYVGYLEINPESICRWKNGKAVLHDKIINDLKSVNNQIKLIAHGTGLSIGSYEGYSEVYLEILSRLMEQVELTWHSEHLGYTKVGGENLNTMQALPKTQEMLDTLIPRIEKIQHRFGIPFLLENIVHLLPVYPGDYTDAEFLNIIVRETGCGLILDIYNLECDAYNYNFDIQRFINEINLEAVKEIHIARGTIYKGFQLDIHSNEVADSTLELTKEVLKMSGSRNIETITFEIMPQAVTAHGNAMVLNELNRLSKIFNTHVQQSQRLSA